MELISAREGTTARFCFRDEARRVQQRSVPVIAWAVTDGGELDAVLLEPGGQPELLHSDAARVASLIALYAPDEHPTQEQIAAAVERIRQ